uniref:Decapping nuclease n=1 Tax=Rhipicephalus zambeziensis TaxID=60191 RepID=A0A224YXP0_9ACAR
MTATMAVLPPEAYQEQAPHYAVSQEVGIYSLVGAEGSYASGNVHGKYLCMPPRRHYLNWNLDDGFAQVERFVRDEVPTMETLYRWILDNKRQFSSAVEAARRDDRSSVSRHKLWKWWSQSYIMGMKRVICGCRDREGFVRSLMEFDVDTMHEQCEQEDLWFRAQGLNFLDKFLSFVRSNMRRDEPRVVYLFTYEPGLERVTCKRLDAPGEYQVLPDWFLNEF